MRVMLLLFLRDHESPEEWVPEGAPIRYDGNDAMEKAERYGEQWVERDPENRRYELHSY